nr:uncharacterized protein LOC111993163 [Quercus suber]
MSLHKDFEPIQSQLLNRSPPPSLDTAVNELQSDDSSGSSNHRKQTNKKFCTYCKRPSQTIETCYRRNKSTAAVANTEPTLPMPSISAESQSSGSTINLSPTELQEIIAQVVRMAGNASLSTALSVLPDKSQTWLFDDPRTGQELRTGPRVGCMFPADNLHLPPVAPVSVAVAVSSLPSLALWHSRLGHASFTRVDDELAHFEPRSLAPAPPEDPPQDIPPRHLPRLQ